MQRQLAAILFADVAGYTRLLDVYEQETHPRLLALFNEVIDPAIATETGRVVKYTGDGFLACFASVNSAIKAAIEILQETHRREADRPDDRRIAFRMGCTRVTSPLRTVTSTAPASIWPLACRN